MPERLDNVMRWQRWAAIGLAAVSTSCAGSGVAHVAARQVASASRAVPWVGQPGGPYEAPATRPQPRRATNARPCAAGDVSARMASGNGAGGHSVRYVRFRNRSATVCVLKGYPNVTVFQPGRPPVTGSDGSFFPTSGTANLRTGQDGFLGLETDTYCPTRPSGGPPGPRYHGIQINLPGGGSVSLRDGPGLDVTCGLHLTRFAVQPLPRRAVHDPLGDLEVSLFLPREVGTGATLTYVAALSNPTDKAISLTRCPSYVEGDRPTTFKAVYQLNCGPVDAIPAHHTTRFQMRLRIPPQTPAGPLTIFWTLAGPFAVSHVAAVNVRT